MDLMTVGHCRYNTVCSVIACLVHRQSVCVCVCVRGTDVCMCARVDGQRMGWIMQLGVGHVRCMNGSPESLKQAIQLSVRRRSRAQWVTRHNVYLTEPQPTSPHCGVALFIFINIMIVIIRATKDMSCLLILLRVAEPAWKFAEMYVS